MDSYKECVRAIKAQEKIKNEADKEIDRISKVMAQKFCPIKIGDIVTVNDFTHTGKQMQVKTVAVMRRWGEVHGFHARGPIIRKDGTPGVQFGLHFREMK